jgi:hypothetical protein
MLVAGCVFGPTQLEMDYGNSYSTAKSKQILAPEAGNNLAPVEGLDGQAADATIKRYRSTFEKPPPPPTFSISLGQSE